MLKAPPPEGKIGAVGRKGRAPRRQSRHGARAPNGARAFFGPRERGRKKRFREAAKRRRKTGGGLPRPFSKPQRPPTHGKFLKCKNFPFGAAGAAADGKGQDLPGKRVNLVPCPRNFPLGGHRSGWAEPEGGPALRGPRGNPPSEKNLCGRVAPETLFPTLRGFSRGSAKPATHS